MPEELQRVGGGEKHLDIVCEGRAHEKVLLKYDDGELER